MTDDDRPRARDDRNESHDQRMDRNWNELLQELRVSQTGVQILAGFLLTLPFQQRFQGLGAQEWSGPTIGAQWATGAF